MFDEPLIADGVASVLSVLAAIDLDDEPLLSTNKIDDIWPDRLLTHEFESAERPRTKVSPKFSFGGRRIFPQLSRQTCLRYVCATHASKPPHPNPLPARGEREVASGERKLFLARQVSACRQPRCTASRQTSHCKKLDTFVSSPLPQARLLSSEGQDAIIDLIAYEPTCGDLIPATGGLRKVRVGRERSGKRGGARVVYYFYGDVPVLLVAIYAKNEKAECSRSRRRDSQCW